MACAESTTHVSPPSGDSRSRAPLMMKSPGDASVTFASALFVILTRSLSPISSGTVHSYVSSAAFKEATITSL